MEPIVIFCKSYLPDLQRLIILLESIKDHNIQNIPVFISVPLNEYDIFKNKLREFDITLISDEEIANDLIEKPINEFNPGYINQQIVKMSFWKQNICENYFCIDSDCMFIRDFNYDDFLACRNENIPYTILNQDKELWVEPNYRGYYEARLEKLKKIQKDIDLYDRRYLTCHGNAILSRKVLKSFEEKFLEPKGLKLSEILKYASYEFSWYNTWLIKDKTIEIYQIEPLIKVFHILDHYSDYLSKKISISDIKNGYLGVCMNSNWTKNYGIQKYGDKIPSRYELFLRKIFKMRYE